MYITKSMLANKKININDVKINLRDAAVFIYHAWKEVSASTIQNCFKKAYFPVDSITEPINNDELFDEQWNQLETSMEFSEFVNMDNDLVTYDAMEEVTEDIESDSGNMICSHAFVLIDL